MPTTETQPPSRSRRGVVTRALAASCPLTVALLLAGCGGASHGARVASLSTPGGAGSHHPASAFASANAGIPDPDGRPRTPLNATNAQEAALYVPYLACLRAHRYIDQFSASARLAVVAKCNRLEPLPPWPLDPSNPQARAFVGRTVTCLEANGYHASADLVTNDPIEAPDWQISYSPHNVQYEHQTGIAQATCQEHALR